MACADRYRECWKFDIKLNDIVCERVLCSPCRETIWEYLLPDPGLLYQATGINWLWDLYFKRSQTSGDTNKKSRHYCRISQFW